MRLLRPSKACTSARPPSTWRMSSSSTSVSPSVATMVVLAGVPRWDNGHVYVYQDKTLNVGSFKPTSSCPCHKPLCTWWPCCNDDNLRTPLELIMKTTLYLSEQPVPTPGAVICGFYRECFWHMCFWFLQAKQHGWTQGRWPKKSAEFLLHMLKNAESNAELKVGVFIGSGRCPCLRHFGGLL